MKKLIISILFGSVITASCSINNKELIGNYSFTGENVIDTLIIKDDIYVHKIYNKSLKLMYQGENKWTFDKDRINLLNFYNNEDNEFQEPLSNKDAKKFLMLVSFPVYKNNDEIIIEVNADENIKYLKSK